jgi:hypothetical protein
MTEEAALEVQERIERIDRIEASFTWPHYKDKDFFTSAFFIRTENDKPYVIYCPKSSTSLSIECHAQDLIFTYNPTEIISNLNLFPDDEDTLFYCIYLGERKPK